MSDDPENLVVALLREMRAEMTGMRNDLKRTDKKIDDLGADPRSEMNSLRADVASDLLTLEKRLSDQIVGLRRAVKAGRAAQAELQWTVR